MLLHIFQLPRLIGERRSSAIFGIVIIAMIWSGVAFKYRDDATADLREAGRTSANFAMVFEESVLRSIGEIDKALLYLRRSIETRRDTTTYHTIANTADVLSEIIVQVAIIDAQGIMRASNAGPQPAPAINLSDREHYRVHVGTDQDRLFISKPVIGRASGQWSVQFTRRFSNADGSFAGVVVASLNPEHLTNFYNSIDFGSSASIALIGADGVVRSSGGSSGGFALGDNIHSGGFIAPLMNSASKTFESIDPATGKASLVTLRAVRGHPLSVSVTNQLEEIYRGSLMDLRVNVLVGAVLTFLVLAAMELLLRAEARARQKAEQLRLTLENMSQGIMLVTSDLQIPVINSKCVELLNLPSAFIANPPKFDQLAAYQTQTSAISAGSKESNSRASAPANAADVAVSDRLMPDGSVIEVRSTHLPDGSFVQTFTDITKRREAEAHVTRLASEDPLTGLPNRRVLRSRLEELCQQHQRHSDSESLRPFAALFLDLDRFKVINDTLGHWIGDKLLQEAAARLRASLPETVTVARLGGDEFAVIVPAFDTHAEIEELARGILEMIAKPYEVDGSQIRSGISIGIAIGPRDAEDVDGLLVAADVALYAVKSESRGTFKFFDKSMNAELYQRREIETDLRAAIEHTELELYYQPIVSLRSNTVCGFEALARWRHPTRGMIPPDMFIPIAEDSGLILPLGEWALMKACEAAAQWPEHLKIAVNISPVQLLSPGLVGLVKRVLAENNLSADRLEIEITERTIMVDSNYTLSILRELKEMGVRIAMDDFGTGYSSLSYLQKFPFDKIKIDRSFISDMVEGTEHVVIVQAVVSIARVLGMTITAEGVEVAYQKDFLTALGCDEAQGYLISPAVPLDAVPALIETLNHDSAVAA